MGMPRRHGLGLVCAAMMVLRCTGTGKGVPAETDLDTDPGGIDSPLATDLPVDSDVLTPEERIAALGPRLWVRAADLVADNAAQLERWPARVGPGLVQPTLEQRPRYRATSALGVPVVRFDGIDDRLDAEGGGVFMGDTFTVVAVIGTDDVDGYIVGNLRAGDGYLSAEGAGLVLHGGALGAVARRGVAGVVMGAEAPPFADDTYHIVSAVVRRDASGLWVDGGLIAGSQVRSEVQETEGLSVGHGQRGGEVTPGAWVGDVAELLVFDRPLETCERWEVEAWLASAFGLPVRQEITPPAMWAVAADLDDTVTTVGSWRLRVATEGTVGPLVSPLEDRQPVRVAGVPATVRFDGVDDILYLANNTFTAEDLGPISMGAVVSFDGSDGHIIGAVPTVQDGSSTWRDFGTALVLDGGVPTWSAVKAGAGLVVPFDAPVARGELVALMTEVGVDSVALTVDGRTVTSSGTASRTAVPRATLGAADGNVEGLVQAPLAMDLAELRIYTYAWDACARQTVATALAARRDGGP